jgi:hypothetical protein
VLLATAPELEGVTGCCFAHGKGRKSFVRSHDEGAAARLWRVSADLVGLDAPAWDAKRCP